jgi:hypothetical protein
MPSAFASAAAAEPTVAVLPLEPVLVVLPEEPEPDELELEALMAPPDELLPPAAATLDVLEPLLALSAELPPQAPRDRQADRQAATAAARGSDG